MAWNGRKDRDDDLTLFRDLHKREKERNGSFLQLDSDDYSINGNFSLHRIASGRRGSKLEFLAENDKNDYDWLKTPPATPLFPSLEMEATAPQLVVQKEIPIFQPLSRFAESNFEVPKLKADNGRAKSPEPKAKLPLRSATPSKKNQTRSIRKPAETKNSKASSFLNKEPALRDSMISSNTQRRTSMVSSKAKPAIANPKESNDIDFLVSNLSKNIGGTDLKNRKPRSRGVSPSVRSTIPAQIPEFSNETPNNLRTDRRSISATRPGRIGNPITCAVAGQNPESNPRTCRQSCSPSDARGRKQLQSKTEGNLSVQRGRTSSTLGVNGNVPFVGSKMVDKIMNARKSVSNQTEKETTTKSRGIVNNDGYGYGYGRITSKSSLDKSPKLSNIRY
ncbi:mucin-2-like isoform X1 [Quillaja saponaria]|uniref:Mucin-2-like isoform X1 n=1 Tax=Quillaja saponaria TaxID=32244 RepID=A0AAD7M6C9_QUISA|nr:mucin-2-like isoform X1 [Quillaja saponaria]